MDDSKVISAFETGRRRDYPGHMTIHEQVAAWARRTPNARALQFGAEIFTYREVAVRARRIGEFLRERGVRRGSVAAVLDRPSMRLISTLLGILYAGGTYLPLDAVNPLERSREMVRGSRADIVLTDEAHAGGFDAVPLGALDSLLSQPARPDEPIEPLSLGHPLDVAYVMYTSGSSGHPKGVMVPHRAVTRVVVNTDYVSLGASDVIAQASNLAFDAATFEIWGALLNGASLVGLSRDQVMIPQELSAALERYKITTIFLTTALFHLHAAEQPDVFRGLRDLLVGGEAMDPAAARAVLAAGPPKRLLNMYGPTEATVFSTSMLVTRETARANTVPIGCPIANTDVRILEGTRPAAPGETGELHIGGAGLALGYVSQSGLTAERFVASAQHPGGRLYRTGDLGRWLPDGTIEFLGRIDGQVKLRGFRIELGEIETVARRHPAVTDAVVKVDGEAAAKRLVAYIVTDRPETAGDVERYLAMRLPPYMVPAIVVPVASFPLNANGKVDRAGLALPGRLRSPGAADQA